MRRTDFFKNKIYLVLLQISKEKNRKNVINYITKEYDMKLTENDNNKYNSIKNTIIMSDLYYNESLVPFNTFISNDSKHPGAGKSYIIDNVLTNEFLEYIYNQFLIVPVFEIKKDNACSDRSYYCDYNYII
jgi:hypothetical protein